MWNKTVTFDCKSRSWSSYVCTTEILHYWFSVEKKLKFTIVKKRNIPQFIEFRWIQVTLLKTHSQFPTVTQLRWLFPFHFVALHGISITICDLCSDRSQLFSLQKENEFFSMQNWIYLRCSQSVPIASMQFS